MVVALIAAVPASIAALASLSNRQQLKTPSGTSVGKQVESAHHTAIANNYRLQSLGENLDVPMPEKASSEEARSEQMRQEEGFGP